MVEDGTVTLMSRRETIEDILDLEREEPMSVYALRFLRLILKEALPILRLFLREMPVGEV